VDRLAERLACEDLALKRGALRLELQRVVKIPKRLSHVVVGALLVLVFGACEGDKKDPSAISIVVEPSELQLGRNPVATIKNEGQVAAKFGDGFGLQRDNDGSWADVSTGCLFFGGRRVLPPGESLKEKIYVCDSGGKPQLLDVGRYRVFKEVTVGSSTFTPEAVFEIVASSGCVRCRFLPHRQPTLARRK
jgi:hypothetical protein